MTTHQFGESDTWWVVHRYIKRQYRRLQDCSIYRGDFSQPTLLLAMTTGVVNVGESDTWWVVHRYIKRKYRRLQDCSIYREDFSQPTLLLAMTTGVVNVGESDTANRIPWLHDHV